MTPIYTTLFMLVGTNTNKEWFFWYNINFSVYQKAFNIHNNICHIKVLNDLYENERTNAHTHIQM